MSLKTFNNSSYLTLSKLIENVLEMDITRNFKKIVKSILPERVKNILYYYFVKNLRSSKITGKYNEPWITRDSIKIIDSILKDDFVGLEFGS